jgi:hypothetical protein
MDHPDDAHDLSRRSGCSAFRASVAPARSHPASSSTSSFA